MQNDDNGMTGQQEGATAAPATGGKGFGKGLLNLAKASAREAGRGGRRGAAGVGDQRRGDGGGGHHKVSRRAAVRRPTVHNELLFQSSYMQ